MTSWPRACRAQASPMRRAARPRRRGAGVRRPRARSRPRSPGRARRAGPRSWSSRGSAAASRGRGPRRTWRSAPTTGRRGRSALPGRRRPPRPRAPGRTAGRARASAARRRPRPRAAPGSRRRRARRSRPRRARPPPRAGPRRARPRRHGSRRAASRPGRRPSRRSPSRRARARSRPARTGASHESDIQAARPTWPSAAATRSSAASGTSTSVSSAAANRSEKVPSRATPSPRPEAQTRVPGSKRADCTTRPTPSIPGTYGSGGLPAGNRPEAIARSAGLSAAREQLDDRLAVGRLRVGALADLGRSLVRGDDRGAQQPSPRLVGGGERLADRELGAVEVAAEQLRGAAPARCSQQTSSSRWSAIASSTVSETNRRTYRCDAVQTWSSTRRIQSVAPGSSSAQWKSRWSCQNSGDVVILGDGLERRERAREPPRPARRSSRRPTGGSPRTRRSGAGRRARRDRRDRRPRRRRRAAAARRSGPRSRAAGRPRGSGCG